MKTLLYANSGDTYLGVSEITSLPSIKELFRNTYHQSGYLIGFRYFDNERQRVIVGFKDKPQNLQAEILKRRTNGFKAAQWYSL